MSKTVIDVQNLQVRLPHPPFTTILKGLDFKVQEGEVYGILGESGAGKSLLIRTLTGFFPYEGTVHKPQNIQLVPQDPVCGLHPRHTVYKILEEPLYLRKDFNNKEERIRYALEEVHLEEEHLHRFPHELSGGQRQRVCIARALITRPSVVFLDEPTSALDAFVKKRMLLLLKELQKKHKLTYIFVAHSLSAVVLLSDRVAIMRQGEILETVSPEDLEHLRVSHDYTKELVTAYQALSDAS